MTPSICLTISLMFAAFIRALKDDVSGTILFCTMALLINL